MQKDILFISDLHIALEKPQITNRFLSFLKNQAARAQAVYILGDLFDAWVGDDDFTPPNNLIRQELKQLTEAGIPVYLQPGNRDFLLGQKFCRDTGIQLLDDYVVIDLFGTPTLLTHGDLLCTDDLAYQAFRIKSHTPEWKQNVLSKPLPLRLLMARWYRFRSYFHKRKQSLDIMDVNQDSVIKVMSHYRCTRLIHGHTHRPDIHHFEINGQPAQRHVLAAWEINTAKVLCWSSSGYRIEII